MSPILVTTHLKPAMVRALLEGRKVVHQTPDLKPWIRALRSGAEVFVAFKEAYFRRSHWSLDGDLVRGNSIEDDVRYVATDARPTAEDDGEEFWEFREAIYLPKFAWRCFGRVTSLEFERLDSTTNEIALAEGVIQRGAWFEGGVHPEKHRPQLWSTPLRAYQRIWEMTHGDKPGLSWDADPVVARFSFEPVEKKLVQSLTGSRSIGCTLAPSTEASNGRRSKQNNASRKSRSRSGIEDDRLGTSSPDLQPRV